MSPCEAKTAFCVKIICINYDSRENSEWANRETDSETGLPKSHSEKPENILKDMTLILFTFQDLKTDLMDGGINGEKEKRAKRILL